LSDNICEVSTTFSLAELKKLEKVPKIPVSFGDSLQLLRKSELSIFKHKNKFKIREKK
jgi:hypothetical protein